MILWQIVLLIIGFILLIKGADYFVDAISSLAINLNIPKIVIGIIIIGFGTNTPELAIAIKSILSGNSDIIIGEVFGSNISNILLILPLGTLITPYVIRKDTLRKDLPFLMLISTIMLVLFLDMTIAGPHVNQITKVDAIAILIFFAIFLYYTISGAIKNKEKTTKEKPKYKVRTSIIIAFIALLSIILGSNLVVNGAVYLANFFGMTERLIALTIISLGTGLPEIIITIISAKKGETDLIIGNILGSNIFNICTVLGLTVLIFGNVTSTSFNYIDVIYLIGSALILYIISMTDSKITKKEGILLLSLYASYFILILLT